MRIECDAIVLWIEQFIVFPRMFFVSNGICVFESESIWSLFIRSFCWMWCFSLSELKKKMAMTFVFSFRLNQSHWKFEIKWKCELKMLQIMGKVSSQYVICDGYSSRGHLLLVVSSGCDGNVVRYGFSACNCEHSTIVGVVLLWTFHCLQCPVGLQERLVVSCCLITHPS